jgi:hypothetical protein
MKLSIALSPLLLAACVSNEPRPSLQPIVVGAVPQPTLEELAADAERTNQPRGEHRRLDVLAGNWTTSFVAVAADGKESDAHAGEAHIAWTLGGHYLEWDSTLQLATGTRASRGFLGYDTNHAEYQLVMISDLATGMGVTRGNGDITGAGIRFVLEVVDGRDGAIKRAQSVLKVIDRDHFVLDQISLGPEGVERVVRRTHHHRIATAAKK